MPQTIVSATVGPFPRTFGDPMPSVTATFSDGTVKAMFSFYPDELSFSEREFIGLTRDQAMNLRHRKDVAYLQS